MMNRLTTKLRNASPYVTLISLLIGVIGVAAAVVLFLRHSNVGNQTIAEANDLVPYAARLDQLDGGVEIARQTGSDQLDWGNATVNAPVSIGDRLYVPAGSKAAIAFSQRDYCRLNPNTSLDVLSLSEGRTQLALRDGSCIFDVGSLDSDEFFEVGTPEGAVDFVEPGLYQVAIDESGHTNVCVLNGHARVAGLGGSGEITRGQVLTLAATAAAEAFASALSPDVAGRLVDDYYSYRYRDAYDGRFSNYDAYLSDPDYYYRYRKTTTYQYIPDDNYVAGLDDLDEDGDWDDVPGYGHCWHPRVSAGWAPYRDGYWTNDYPLGLTWVSNERWGWAPYHYGRWAYARDTWYWVPGEAVKHPVYAPALVAFVQLPRADRVGWLPLGPGDPYVPRYYDADYRPQYIGSKTTVNNYVNMTKVVNYSVPNAVTVVPTSQFTRVITPTSVETVDTNVLARTRPVVDAYSVPNLRQLAPHIDATRSPASIPVEVQQRLARPVMTSKSPSVPPVAAPVLSSLKVRPIPASESTRKLKINNTGQTVATTSPNGVPAAPPPPVATQNQQATQQTNNALPEEQRKARIAALQSEAAQGNKAAKSEMRQLKREEQLQEEQQRRAAAQQQAAQQAQQAESRRLANQAVREQAKQAQQAKAAEAAQQAELRKEQRKAARQAQRNAPQQAAQQAQQAEQLKAQRKAQKEAARQQQQQAEQQRQAQQAQQAQQRRAQMEAARQKAQQQAQQQQAQEAQKAQQRKAEREVARQRAQQQQAQQQQADQQRKAQAEAARQKAQQQAQQQQADQQRKAQAEAARQKAQQQQQAQEQRKAQKAERQAQKQRPPQAEQQRQPQKAERPSQRNAEQPKGQSEQKKGKKANKNKNAKEQ